MQLDRSSYMFAIDRSFVGPSAVGHQELISKFLLKVIYKILERFLALLYSFQSIVLG